MRSKMLLMAWLAVALADAQRVQICSPAFVSVYDIPTLNPHQVEWTLRASDLGTAPRDADWNFKNDVPDRRAKARQGHYVGSGYDRGHLCPAQDRSRSVALMRSTFVMSNCSPQVPSVNRGSWLQTEVACRALALQYDSIKIVVQPVFLHRDTARFSKRNIAVPHAFFKAAFTATDSVVGCWFIFNH